MKKNYYQKIIFMGILLIILFTFQKLTNKDKEDFSNIKFITENISIQDLSYFDPNDLDEKQWKNLGFSEKQAVTILKYKKYLGGKFTSKEQLKKCFAISAEKFSELNKYILLPESTENTNSTSSKNYENKTVLVSRKFNPDNLSITDWIKMGFTKKQAEAILKYKNYLGGSFISKEKFKECFIINEENYKKIAPYLILPEKTTASFKNFTKNIIQEKPQIKYSPFDPNVINIEGWQNLGFSKNQAKVIINYRDKNLKGSFKSLEDIQKCFVISTKKFNELKPYIKLNISTIAKNTEPAKIELKQEKTDFSKIDLNTITFKQLLEFGLDKKSASSIIGFRKKLGGFVNKQQILNTYNIDKNLVKKLISICQLYTNEVQKYTLVDAPEEWLKNHPYFKYSADKIIFYRENNPDEKKIFKFLKLKPEYEARMKLYLK